MEEVRKPESGVRHSDAYCNPNSQKPEWGPQTPPVLHSETLTRKDINQQKEKKN